MLTKSPVFLVFGFGYVGRFFCDYLASKNITGQVYATSRHPEVSHKAVSMLYFDEKTPLKKDIFDQITHCLITIPPQNGQDSVLLHHYQDLLKAPKLEWISYLSSTAVYGDAQGNWVTELSPCLPKHATGKNRLQAETSWQNFFNDMRAQTYIFRLSGIYGPGRSVLDKVSQKTYQSLYAPDQFFSRIHVEDIAHILYSSLTRPIDSGIYNVADAEPAPTYQLADFAAQLLGLPQPKRIALDLTTLSPALRRFYEEKRRIDTTKLQATFPPYLYPTFREGLKSIHKSMKIKEI